jgi:hypothetical protein
MDFLDNTPAIFQFFKSADAYVKFLSPITVIMGISFLILLFRGTFEKKTAGEITPRLTYLYFPIALLFTLPILFHNAFLYFFLPNVMIDGIKSTAITMRQDQAAHYLLKSALGYNESEDTRRSITCAERFAATYVSQYDASLLLHFRETLKATGINEQEINSLDIEKAQYLYDLYLIENAPDERLQKMIGTIALAGNEFYATFRSDMGLPAGTAQAVSNPAKVGAMVQRMLASCDTLEAPASALEQGPLIRNTAFIMGGEAPIMDTPSLKRAVENVEAIRRNTFVVVDAPILVAVFILGIYVFTSFYRRALNHNLILAKAPIIAIVLFLSCYPVFINKSVVLSFAVFSPRFEYPSLAAENIKRAVDRLMFFELLGYKLRLNPLQLPCYSAAARSYVAQLGKESPALAKLARNEDRDLSPAQRIAQNDVYATVIKDELDRILQPRRELEKKVNAILADPAGALLDSDKRDVLYYCNGLVNAAPTGEP